MKVRVSEEDNPPRLAKDNPNRNLSSLKTALKLYPKGKLVSDITTMLNVV